ncbi:heparinase [Novosphingobium marinum]|uniref:Putative heparinase superfamily protein n=1 Tax=Novosphingobium marinum TaxID=1514948 RepID=A0A7Y9XWJ2_9SPHN|nr:heparinase II/III family protein [Novosphingobium marinum]NYH94628.1 putative heparinase superfamily protein [Novosphingobium marinum]GGC38635.1 heparinase [Novosphingobium marinum]
MADAYQRERITDHEPDEFVAPAVPLGPGFEDTALNDPQPAETQPSPQQSIEPGRALALADFAPPSLGAGERLIRLAYRMGVPSSMLTSPMGRRVKTRLLATVSNPLPGDRVAGTALRAGHFLVHGSKTPIAQVEFGGAARMTPPLERVVHSFSWLADVEACAPREQGAPIAERILAEWLQANETPPARPGKGPAWSIGNTGSRLLHWLVHAPLVLSGIDKGVRSRALSSISQTARWLDRNVGKAEDGLAEVAGWCGIVAAGLLLPDGRPRRLFGEAGLMRALGELVGDDGGVLSRSPVAQMEAIALLVKLSACYRATRRDPPEAVDTMLGLLVPPLLALTHGDGSLGSWQGGWAIDAAEVAALVEASGVRTRPLRDVRQWGYQRIVAQKSVLQFDAAPPPMPRHARHGCASTLAFEMSHEGQRLIVNCGGSACAGGLVPVRLEQGLRVTAAHSTLVLDDANSTAIQINGAIGSGVSEVDVDRRTVEAGDASKGATRLEGSHNGYAARYGLTHRRILIMRDDGTELRGEDLLVPAGRKGKRGKVGYAIRFHLGPGIETGLSEDGQGVGLALPDGSLWQFRAGSGEVSVEDSIWVDGRARPVPIQQIVLQGLISRGGGSFSWLLKKMG